VNSDNEYFIEADIENGWLSRNARARKVVKDVVMKFRCKLQEMAQLFRSYNTIYP